jgi:putative intracellular protease/amidase
MKKMQKRVLFVLMPHDFQDIEFLEPYEALASEGHKIDVAGFLDGPAIGSNGYKHEPDFQISDLGASDFDDYDAIVIPGGSASTQYLWDNENLQDIVRYFHENKKLVATICYACIVPVQAEILQNKTATVFPTEESKRILEEHSVNFSDKDCVVLSEEKIITGKGPASARKFSQAIVDAL